MSVWPIEDKHTTERPALQDHPLHTFQGVTVLICHSFVSVIFSNRYFLCQDLDYQAFYSIGVMPLYL